MQPLKYVAEACNELGGMVQELGKVRTSPLLGNLQSSVLNQCWLQRYDYLIQMWWRGKSVACGTLSIVTPCSSMTGHLLSVEPYLWDAKKSFVHDRSLYLCRKLIFRVAPAQSVAFHFLEDQYDVYCLLGPFSVKVNHMIKCYAFRKERTGADHISLLHHCTNSFKLLQWVPKLWVHNWKRRKLFQFLLPVIAVEQRVHFVAAPIQHIGTCYGSHCRITVNNVFLEDILHPCLTA